MEELARITYMITVVALWLLSIVVYRLYIHPLAKIPGPRFAAVSRFYEWYSDCVQPGMYGWKIKDWHKQYGPVVRIGPSEVHISDPDWYDVFYSSSAKHDKDPWFYGFIGNHDSTFTTIDHEAHRIKRSKQSPFFSRQNVDRSISIITATLTTMLDRFERYRNTGQPLPMRNAFKSFTADIVCEYCFSKGMEFSKSSDFGQAHHSGQDNFLRLFPWFRHFPSLGVIVTNIPGWVTPYMDKPTQAAVSFIRFIETQVEQSIHQSKAKETSGKRCIIREIYESDIPDAYRTQQSLEHEAMVMVSAGSSPVARTAESGLFYILQDPAIVARLVDEIRAFKPEEKGILTQRELEGLPYLSAVVLECQRRHPVILGRFPRINRNHDVVYKNYLLPKGTTVAMTIWDVLLNDQIWGNAYEFQPSRWLNPTYKAKMQKYLVPFGRGSRQCVGQNLALAELYMLLGNFFRRFDVELVNTDESEIKTVQDCFEAIPYKGSTGVKVLLR